MRLTGDDSGVAFHGENKKGLALSRNTAKQRRAAVKPNDRQSSHPPWLVVSVLQNYQSTTWIWVVNYFHVQLTDQPPGTIEKQPTSQVATLHTSVSGVMVIQCL